jgi:hypothetical protein
VAPFPNHYIAASANCNEGERATGGGFLFTNESAPQSSDDVVNYAGPAPTPPTPITGGTVPTRWVAQLYDVNGDDTANNTVVAYVVCAAP